VCPVVRDQIEKKHFLVFCSQEIYHLQVQVEFLGGNDDQTFYFVTAIEEKGLKFEQHVPNNKLVENKETHRVGSMSSSQELFKMKLEHTIEVLPV
jgi:hypothetical protein